MKRLLSALGPVTAIIGAQWGDEGKGKVTDILGEHYDVIARACGGANAGHTIVVGGNKHIFKLLPAGCLHDKPVVLGSGMVIHLPTLLKEIATLKDAGIDLIPRLIISPAAHILFEFHKAIDGALEDRRSQGGIGTTRRGIGPAYMDKAARSGIRMGSLTTDLKPEIQEKAKIIKEMYGIDVDVSAELKEIDEAKSLLQDCVAPSMIGIMKGFLDKKKTILIEGAQATLLDLDHGTYPYVTSSFTTAAGALQGLGLAPSALKSNIGVAKAYCTRVGAGDFPAEDTGERGDRLRERGGEYGSNTGRPRRCGWFSVPDLQYSSFINGHTCLNLTKLDVLDEEDTIPVLTGLTPDGKPVFETLPGWKTSTSGITEWKKLPKEAQNYIEFIEKQVGVPVSLIGTGPGREHIIVR